MEAPKAVVAMDRVPMDRVQSAKAVMVAVETVAVLKAAGSMAVPQKTRALPGAAPTAAVAKGVVAMEVCLVEVVALAVHWRGNMVVLRAVEVMEVVEMDRV